MKCPTEGCGEDLRCVFTKVLKNGTVSRTRICCNNHKILTRETVFRVVEAKESAVQPRVVNSVWNLHEA